MTAVVQFVSYLRATGQIVGSGTTCAPDALASADVGVLTGVSASPEHDYVAAGQVMPKGARPSPAHQFDYASGAWVDPRSLDELRAAKWAQIKADRDADIVSPLVTAHGTFDADAQAQVNIGQTVLLANNMLAAGVTTPIRYTLADNSRPSFTAAQIIAVGFAMAAKVQTARDHADSLRTQINAAATREQLESISWTS